jgi:hypothetical protein
MQLMSEAKAAKHLDQRVTVNLSAAAYARLIQTAEAQEVPASQLIRRAVARLLAENEETRSGGA